MPDSLKKMDRVNYTFLKGGNTLTIIKFFHEPSHYSPSTHQLPAPITPFNTCLNEEREISHLRPPQPHYNFLRPCPS